MITYNILPGTVDVSVVIRIVDSTDGTPETGVVFDTAGIDLEYRREGAASTDITEATLAALTTAHADGGFLHIGNGYYRLDLPDAACATGAPGVLVHGVVTGMVVIGCYIQLEGFVNSVYTRIGAPAGASIAADIVTLDNFIDTEVAAILADTNELQTDWADGGRLDLILDAAGSAGDPWATTIPGAYGAGTAGLLLGTTIPNAITAIDDLLDTELPALTTAVADLPTNAELATSQAAADDATLAAIATLQTSVNTIDDLLDTEIPALTTAVADLPTNAELATALGTADDAVLTAIGDLPTNAELATALGTADDAVLAAIAALNNLSAAQVATEIADALGTDTYAEPTGVPAATAALATKLGYVFMALRNRIDVTATKKTFYDDGGAAEWEKDLSDDGTTYSESEGNAI